MIHGRLTGARMPSLPIGRNTSLYQLNSTLVNWFQCFGLVWVWPVLCRLPLKITRWIWCLFSVGDFGATSKPTSVGICINKGPMNGLDCIFTVPHWYSAFFFFWKILLPIVESQGPRRKPVVTRRKPVETRSGFWKHCVSKKNIVFS